MRLWLRTASDGMKPSQVEASLKHAPGGVGGVYISTSIGLGFRGLGFRI